MAHRVKHLQRATMLLAGAALATLGISAPASAQVDPSTVLNIMRECAKIDDPSARLACYDNNIRAGGGSPRMPGAGERVQGGGAVVGSGGNYGVQGFGAESVKSPDRFKSSEDRGVGPEEIRAKIVEVREREPGIYLLTLEGGAQWVFTDSVSRGFRVPRKGAIVELQRASLGSFLMVVDGQAAVRVKRVK
ncbi:hypothetical protein SZ64_05245 [Erythrobacter sp. SG61-1L]|uniref:hypothetical protein n=1 Tax=Erythrobacter sp. SG61-1L TaxID=1603897 RepID=UPI0006C929F9|nr:hypothetical protein [Erythrobacter sp. SG61-1L]KPL67565.1 hypothetical protein SZ64_05245 [Erythrobacter sp. SG61-1L]